VGPSGADVAFRRVDTHDRKTEPGHRFGEKSSTAADVQQAKALERPAGG
jgi:hypothetical protein